MKALFPRTLWTASLAALLAVLFLTGGCSPREGAEGGGVEEPSAESGRLQVEVPEPAARGFYLGTLPTPARGETFQEAYAEAARHADFAPVWGRPSPFYSLAADLAGEWGRTFVDGYIRGNGMFPLIQLSFIGPGLTLALPPGLEEATLASPDWREAYRDAALAAVRASRPRYISLGNEVNRWYEKYGAGEGPNSFRHFVSLYEEIYAAIKEISPETLVFCTFAREVVSEHREADLGVLSLFDPDTLDLLVLTSYPYALRGVNRPSDLPDDYYSRALAYMPDKPFGFSELGWPSLEAFGGEQGQADFLLAATGRLTLERGIDLELLGWPWLHDLDDADSLGLIRRSGEPKLAYAVWTGF